MIGQVSTGKKVFVGMSGGVDSSVSAALLKQATPNNFPKLFGRPTPKGFRGYEVTGVFIKVWTPDFIECTWKEDRLDAMRVCAKLGIPFITLDLSKEYKKEVVDYMISEYKAGKTPNPDIMCNRYVKFGGFFRWARAQGADYVATGHYARVVRVESLKSKVHKVGRRKVVSRLYGLDGLYRLLTGLDPNKDQSYFLWTLTQEQLAHTFFPVGHLEKPEVRKLAKKFGLPTADKKDSQGLCFLGKINVKEFLKHYIKAKPGNVLNEQGEIIGTHDGAVFFTLGERHGFKNVRVRHPMSDILEMKPYYLVAKDIKKNTLTVSHDPKTSISGNSRTVFKIGQVNWLGIAPASGAKLLARIRYRQPMQSCILKCPTSDVGHFEVHFEESQVGGAAGQSIVFYDGEMCLGGGVIN